MPPECPKDYSCTFTQLHPRVIYHTIGPWWEHAAGWVVAIVAIIALAVVLCWIVVKVANSKNDKRKREDLQHERETKLEIEKQKTYQADLAKGNPDMLREIRRNDLS